MESGVRSLTLARVGERAGYSCGIVTHHFGSKQALVDELARSVQSGFVPGPGDTPGPERLLALVDGFVGALDSVDTGNPAGSWKRRSSHGAQGTELSLHAARGTPAPARMRRCGRSTSATPHR